MRRIRNLPSGVYPVGKKFRVIVRVDGVQISVGYYNEVEDAERAAKAIAATRKGTYDPHAKRKPVVRKYDRSELPTGVYQNGNRFMAIVSVNGVHDYGGTFSTPEEAAPKAKELCDHRRPSYGISISHVTDPKFTVTRPFRLRVTNTETGRREHVGYFATHEDAWVAGQAYLNGTFKKPKPQHFRMTAYARKKAALPAQFAVGVEGISL